MIKLYRGILDKYTSNIRKMEDDFKDLVRESHVHNPEDTGFGSTGFWNFLLEIVLTLFVKSFIIIAVVLTVSLAIIFFPLNAIKNAFNYVMPSFAAGPRFLTEEPVRQEPTIERKRK
jgi:hypothetical protein